MASAGLLKITKVCYRYRFINIPNYCANNLIKFHAMHREILLPNFRGEYFTFRFGYVIWLFP